MGATFSSSDMTTHNLIKMCDHVRASFCCEVYYVRSYPVFATSLTQLLRHHHNCQMNIVRSHFGVSTIDTAQQHKASDLWIILVIPSRLLLSYPWILLHGNLFVTGKTLGSPKIWLIWVKEQKREMDWFEGNLIKRIADRPRFYLDL